MTRQPPEWDKSFSISDRVSACRFVESVWNDERVPPVRIHARGPQPRDLSGSPRWSGAFAAYIFQGPYAIYRDRDTVDGVVVDRWFYKYPLARALAILEQKEHDRWTKGVPRRPFHPSVTGTLHRMAIFDFEPERVRLRYKDGTAVPPDMAELFMIGAARKLRSVFQMEVVGEHIEKSEAQNIAEAS